MFHNLHLYCNTMCHIVNKNVAGIVGKTSGTAKKETVKSARGVALYTIILKIHVNKMKYEVCVLTVT